MSSARPMKCSVSQSGHAHSDVTMKCDSDVAFNVVTIHWLMMRL
jgi:hypothetical protein